MSCFLQIGILFVDPKQIVGFQVRWEGASANPTCEFSVVMYVGAHALVCSSHSTCELALAHMYSYMRTLSVFGGRESPANQTEK